MRRQFPLTPMEPPREEPIAFGLGDEWFECAERVPASASYALTSLGAMEGSMGFIRGCVLEEQRSRFDAVISRTARGEVVTDTVLQDVLSFLVEAYTQRPTSPPSNSPDGRLATQDGSEAKPSSAEVLAR